MARRGIPKGRVNWYLREWMDACGLKGRGAQAKMCELTGWSKASMSQLYNGSQDYSPKIITEAARALKIAEYELLMHPDHAMALRRLQTSAQQIVSLAHDADRHDDGHEPGRQIKAG
jgi:transcriptional regulator with XRE-family HTH domain